MEPLTSWTKQEKWVWQRVSQRGIADFNKADGYGGELDPKQPESWPERRVLTPKFLKIILLREPYRRAITHHGVVIVGAWFKQPLNLSNAILAHQLALLDSIFDSDVNLSFLKTPHSINMRGSKFNGKLAMIDLEVESNLCMGDGAEFADEIFLTAAKIGGGVEYGGFQIQW